MFICVCKAVTEKDIHEAVKRGASTVRDLRDELGVAQECASCGRCARTCLQRAKLAVESAAAANAEVRIPDDLRLKTDPV